MFYAFDINGKIVTRFLKKRPPNCLAPVPQDIPREDFEYLKAEPNPEQPTGDPFEQYESWIISVDEIAKGEALLEADKESQKVSLRASYIADIDAEMTRIFGTVDRDKANALYNTWYEFLKDPSYFSTKGLTDDQGLPLDTASKVTDFAQAKVNECKDYAVFLINREKQYIDAKNAL